MNLVKSRKKINPAALAQKNIEIANCQKIKSINIKNIRCLAKEILSLLSEPNAYLSIIFCDNKFIKKINKRFFNEICATDVISFPLRDSFSPNYLGEIIICVEQAKEVSTLYGNTWRQELVLYLIHGILHLLGYEDKKNKESIIMHKKQKIIFEKINKTHKKIISTI